MSASKQPEKRMDLATAIQVSLRAFVWGIIGFLPVIGLLPGFYVLSCWSRVRTQFGNEWNPASRYLIAGVVLSTLGLIASICLVLVIFADIVLS
jgi:hypothetical protein